MNKLVSGLNQKKYSSAISIYYRGDLDFKLAEAIIEYVWLNKGDRHNFQLIKQDKAKVYKMNFNACDYYLKSYAHRSVTKILKNFFRPVEAVRIFKTGIKLINADIAIANPVMALTCKKNLFITDSIFVMEKVPGVELYTYLLKFAQYSENFKINIIKKIALLWSRLVCHKFIHLDPGLRNLMIYPKEGDFQIKLIDIDNIYPMSYVPIKLILMKNLSRLRRIMLSDVSSTKIKALTSLEFSMFFFSFIKDCKGMVEFDGLKQIFKFLNL